MKIQFLRVVSFLFGLMACHIALGASPTECAQKIPPGLSKLLSEKYPNMRLPKLADLDRENIGFDLSDGGDGCFAVTSGDYAGQGKKDLAILLMPNKGDTPQLVAALTQGDTWALYSLPTFCESIAYCYVKTEKPGTYKRSEALDSPPTRSDEREKITSKNAVITSGRFESTGIVYAYLKSHWLYVWVSD